jgi:hypothetical protein
MLTLSLIAIAGGTPIQGQGKIEDQIEQSEKAARVFREIMDTPDKTIPETLLDGTRLLQSGW